MIGAGTVLGSFGAKLGLDSRGWNEGLDSADKATGEFAGSTRARLAGVTEGVGELVDTLRGVSEAAGGVTALAAAPQALKEAADHAERLVRALERAQEQVGELAALGDLTKRMADDAERYAEAMRSGMAYAGGAASALQRREAAARLVAERESAGSARPGPLLLD
ncbi:MAG: hypothetical protein KJZ65_06660 [Phycisphaerales bacterium]|nr:hypothetical protein [Phycisphaerales bacterium]